MTTTTITRTGKTATIAPAADISSTACHTITVRETFERHGRFEIELVDGSTLPASRTPLLSAARHLMRERANPKAVIEMRHAGKPDVIALSARISAAAKLCVYEDQESGPRFRKWRPMPDRPLTAGRSIACELLL